MVAMNTNDLLAAGGGPHTHIGFGVILLALIVLGALGYGAMRLTQRTRLNRPPRPLTKPGPPQPVPEA